MILAMRKWPKRMIIVFASITFYSNKTTYLAAATATAHDKKQFRDSLPPNPPPKGKRWQKKTPALSTYISSNTLQITIGGILQEMSQNSK